LAVVVSLVFFRANNFDTAMNVLAGMSGLDGRFVLTVGYAPLVEPLAWLIGDISISEIPLRYFSGREEIAWLVLVLLVVLATPNTQQWMRKYRPALGDVKPFSIAQKYPIWRPNWIWSVVTIGMLVFALIASLQPSEFLYFQF
jgi:hypothetical protein